MVWCIGNDLDFERAKLIQQLRTPLLELTAIMAHDHGDWMKELGNSVDLVEMMPSPRFIKSHLPWELLPRDLEVVQPKVRANRQIQASPYFCFSELPGPYPRYKRFLRNF